MNIFSHRYLLLFMSTALLICCKSQEDREIRTENIPDNNEKNIPHDLQWSERMVLTVMKENPKPWERSFGDRKYWNYTDGLVLSGIKKVSEQTSNPVYKNFVRDYLEASKGDIPTYQLEDYNIDMINNGKLLFDFYEETKDTSYLKTIKLLRKQLENHPRTKSGGFWHKKIYPNQMWLDGLYMGQPFYARYTATYEEGKNFDDIVHQFDLIQQHTYDKKTGLLYHAWDESKKMDWANPETGKSPNFWSRALGWYMMALVDVLDYLPENHSGHEKLRGYLNDLSAALVKFQEPTGLWYQVPDRGDLEDNYLEASGSLMFAYAFAKGSRKGYLPKSYKEVAEKTFEGVITNFITVGEDGHLYLSNICSSAGLGGDPYRDGSLNYYLLETKQVINDPHGTGPFILASAELNK